MTNERAARGQVRAREPVPMYKRGGRETPVRRPPDAATPGPRCRVARWSAHGQLPHRERAPLLLPHLNPVRDRQNFRGGSGLGGGSAARGSSTSAQCPYGGAAPRGECASFAWGFVRSGASPGFPGALAPRLNPQPHQHHTLRGPSRSPAATLSWLWHPAHSYVQAATTIRTGTRSQTGVAYHNHLRPLQARTLLSV
jgi:hypothetical protein